MTRFVEKSNGPTENFKEKNASHIFNMTFRNIDHFYKVVNWLNTNVGKGKDKWTIEGRVLRQLKQSTNPVTRKVYIYVKDFDSQSSLYLNLI